MITVTIAVAAIIATSVMGYFTISYKNKAKDSSVKYESIKEFADNAASKILDLEAANKQLSDKVAELLVKLMAVPNSPVEKPVEAVSQQKPRRSKRRFSKPKNQNNN